MPTTEQTKQFSDILEELGKSLDITKTQHDAAVQSYKYVGEWLADETSPLAKYNPEILPQGSFLLQTMIRPINEEDELDIDLVCKLESRQADWTQYDLKKIVGDRLKANGRLEPLLKKPDGRRCWTLHYAESAKYHMDVLPSIVATGYKTILEKAYSAQELEDATALGIRITDKEKDNYKTSTVLTEWLKSNPFGYAIWFRNRASLLLEKAVLMSEAVQPVPEFEKKKLPLQRAVQILKRHRDIMFSGDEDKPISIIITTLAAKAYQKETDVADALKNILARITGLIEVRYIQETGKSIKWIGNPVNDLENFADKWEGNPTKEKNFYDWVEKARHDLQSLDTKPLHDIYEGMKNSFGSQVINKSFSDAGFRNIITESNSFPVFVTPGILSVPHRELPKWTMRLTKHVEIHGRYKYNGNWRTITSKVSVPKQCDILFNATTNVPKPFEVYWQVVNTGEEAKHNLRGGIFHSKTFGTGGLTQKEASQYTGTHWVECFIVKDGVCVARSNEFFVNID